MMDLFAVLIPALLMMSAVVEVTMLNVSAPSVGPSDATPPPPSDKPPLNLTINITHAGYVVVGQGGVLSGPGVNPAPMPTKGQIPPTIPIIQHPMSCSRFRNTWPPPRTQNRNTQRCENPMDTRTFWTYDLHALTQKVIDVKDAFPDERRLIIKADADIEYEAVIDVMDATRDIRLQTGEIKPLFDEVLLSPADT